MTTDELLAPRYKVIADYLHSPYAVGDLLNGGEDTWHLTTTNWRDDGEVHKANNYFDVAVIEKHYHLFRKLEWWEDRKPEDLSEYVKTIYSPDEQGWYVVIKVDGKECIHHFYSDGTYFGLKHKNGGGTIATGLLPATKAEYEAYQATLKQQ